MGLITKYQLFEKLNTRGSKSLNEEEFNQILKSSCKNWTKAKTSLYRGQKDLGAYVYTDPRDTHRRSIDDVNIHVELMDNLPCWEGYPKYSSSVIGVSDRSFAERYGRIYEVIPFDNIDIAICPESTIWDSFGGWGDEDAVHLTYNFLESIGINADIWLQFIDETIIDVLKSIGKISDIEIKQNPIKNKFSYHKWSKSDRRYDPYWINKRMDFLSQASEYLKKDVTEISGEDCFKFLNNYLFNPVERKFTTTKYIPGFEIPKNRQIWTEGPVLLIYKELA